jgi:putative NADH-flavin reductase
MKIVVFGATSPTGHHVVELALAAGHKVTAFVRSPRKRDVDDVDHEKLHLLQGDALNSDRVDAAVEGQDAVISLIGPTKGGPKDVASRSTEHILEAMKRHNVYRIVVASVGGIPTSEDQRGLLGKLIGGVLKILLGEMYQDRERQLQLLRESGLDWVALRLPRLTDDPPTGDYELGYRVSPGFKASRADVATAMLDQLTDDTYVGRAPIINT